MMGNHSLNQFPDAADHNLLSLEVPLQPWCGLHMIVTEPLCHLKLEDLRFQVGQQREGHVDLDLLTFVDIHKNTHVLCS